LQQGATEPPKTDPIEKEVWIAARPETIFPFLTDPKKLVLWKGLDAILDPRPGGIYRCIVNPGNIARGEYMAVVPFTLVRFTWGWEGEGSPVPPGASIVEITLIPQGSGTLLRLRHSGLPETERPQHAVGWDHFLQRLTVVAAGGDPGPDPWVQRNPM